jgi:hypothetical protein
MHCVVATLNLGTSGIWMRSSSPFMAGSSLLGEQWISMGLSSRSSCSVAVTRRPPRSSSASCPAGDHHRQASELRSRHTRNPAWGRASVAQRPRVFVQRTHTSLPRPRERSMSGFKSAGQAQRFLSAFGPISSHFRPRRHLMSAQRYREGMRHRFTVWAEVLVFNPAA